MRDNDIYYEEPCECGRQTAEECAFRCVQHLSDAEWMLRTTPFCPDEVRAMAVKLLK